MTVAERTTLKVGDLPALPSVAVKVLELVDDPDTSARELQDAISVDQAMVARILRLSNSAHFAARSPVSTVAQAVALVGLNRIRSLMLAACTESLLDRTHGGFKDKILWDHSLGTAYASKIVAERCTPDLAEEAFVAGLMHDIGKTVLDQNFSDRYFEVIQQVYNHEFDSFAEAEQETFGFDHALVGALVAQKWNLAPSLEEVVRLHHQPDEARIAQPLCAIVSLANGICVKLKCGPERRPDLDLNALPASRLLGLDADDVDSIQEETLQAIERTVADVPAVAG